MGKKYFRAVALFAAAAMAFVSCEKTNEEPNDDKPFVGETITITATTESTTDTRTTLGGTNMRQVHWTDGDEIIIYAGDANNVFTATADVNDGTMAEFSGDPLTGDFSTAIYPAAMTYATSENIITLPAVQTHSTDNVNDGVMPMYVGYIDPYDQSTLTFKNLCGIVKLQLTGTVAVRSIDFISDDYITGLSDIDYVDEAPILSVRTSYSNSKTITLDCGENGVQLDETTPANFHIVVPPTNARYFTLRINSTDGGAMLIQTVEHDDNKIDRNMIITMPVLDVVVTPKAQLSLQTINHDDLPVSNTWVITDDGSPTIDDFANLRLALARARTDKRNISLEFPYIKVFPDKYSTTSVFQGATTLVSVESPQATTIGNRVFEGCYNLTKTYFPNVTSIGEYAFSTASSLTTLSFPKATIIGQKAFSDCSALRNVTIATELDPGVVVTAIHSEAFGDGDTYDTDISEITLTTGVRNGTYTDATGKNWIVPNGDGSGGTNPIGEFSAVIGAQIAPSAKIGDYYFQDGTWSSDKTDETPDNPIIGIVFWVGNPANPSANYSGLTYLGDATLANEEPNCVNGLVVALNDTDGGTTLWQQTPKYVEDWRKSSELNSSTFEVSDWVIEYGSLETLNRIGGYNNSKVIKAFNDDAANSSNKVLPYEKIAEYASATPAPEASSGWYLPSMKELVLLSSTVNPNSSIYNAEVGIDNRDKINGVLKDIGGTELQLTQYWSSTEAHYDNNRADVYLMSFSDGFTTAFPKHLSRSVRAVLAF